MVRSQTTKSDKNSISFSLSGIMVITLCCGCSNPGSIPGWDIDLKSIFFIKPFKTNKLIKIINE